MQNTPRSRAGIVLECLDDVSELEKCRKLFTPDDYEQLAADYKGSSRVIKALCLHVAHTCNLNCSYCFASQGKYHGERALMSFEVGKRALDFLVENSGTRRNLEVDFFGGEPLMNWQVVKELVAYARSIEKDAGKNFRFTLTTNGVPARRRGNGLLQPRDAQRRPLPRRAARGATTASAWTVAGTRQLRRASCRISRRFVASARRTRATICAAPTRTTIPTSRSDLFHMADLGFTELSMEPVVCAPDDPCALTEEDFPVLCEQYELLAKEMLRRGREGKPITFYHYMIDLNARPLHLQAHLRLRLRHRVHGRHPLGRALSPATSSSETRNTASATSGTASRTPQRRRNSAPATPTPAPTATTAGPGSTAPAAAQPTATTPPGSIGGVYEYGCRLFKKRMECAIMLQAASELGDDE